MGKPFGKTFIEVATKFLVEEKDIPVVSGLVQDIVSARAISYYTSYKNWSEKRDATPKEVFKYDSTTSDMRQKLPKLDELASSLAHAIRCIEELELKGGDATPALFGLKEVLKKTENLINN